MGVGASSEDPSKHLPQGKVPKKMKAVMLVKRVEQHSDKADDYAGCFEVKEIDTPVPKSGQVLVKMERSPINPSDLSMLTGTYNSKQQESLPCQMGFEGCGRVIATGGGAAAWFLKGKRVAIVSKGGGVMWSQYAVGNALEAITLPDTASWEDGASCFVNPLTCISFLEHVRAGNHQGLVMTASASALCKMTIRLAKAELPDLHIVSLVRRAEQKQELLDLGATSVVVTSDEKWQDELRQVTEDLKATICFDAVAGELTGQVLSCMPAKSVMYVYGGLSMKHVAGVSPTDLIFADKQVKGFWLTGYIRSKSMFALGGWQRKVQKYISSALQSPVRKSYPLDQLAEALADYNGNMSSGKICIAPSMGFDDDADASSVVDLEEEHKNNNAEEEQDDDAKEE